MGAVKRLFKRGRTAPDTDYVSPGLQYAEHESLFPHRRIGDRHSVGWAYFRKTISHNWYVDGRSPEIGFLNIDESSILHSNAKLFEGHRALEVGAWRGWSAMQIAASGVAHLDVIDPVLSEAAILDEFTQLFRKAGLHERSTFIPQPSPLAVDELVKNGARWSFAFIDGDHEGAGPINDVLSCLPGMNETSMIVLHDLMAPDVAAALDLLRDLGWQVKIYQTNQIMGVAWRGMVKPVHHTPDPAQRWSWPEHLLSYKDRSTLSPRMTYELEFLKIWWECRSFTLTSIERAYSLFLAVKYIVKNGIQGDIVECGVWRGGSAMLIMRTLLLLGDTRRMVWLYDTFSGMTQPSNVDVDALDRPASSLLAQNADDRENTLCLSPLSEVKENIRSTSYPDHLVQYVEGDVGVTLKRETPDTIALLRLDTDFYESTKSELQSLYPVLTERGVLIIDDYGHWRGAKKAVSEYFEELDQLGKRVPLLSAIDYTCRIAVK